MPSYLITRNGVRYFARRVPSKLVPLIGKRFWRETLATSDDAEAHRKAAQLNADCEQAIAVATLEYRRQRSAVARLTGDERAVMEAAGGLTALRKATVGEPLNIEAKAAAVWQSLPPRLRNGLPDEWLRLTRAQRNWLIERWGALPTHDRDALFRGTGKHNRGLRDEARFASAAAEMMAGVAVDRRTPLAARGMDLDEMQEEVAQAEARAATLRARLERNLAILRKGDDGEPDTELASEDPARQAEGENLTTVLDRWARESGAPDQHVGQYRYAVTRFHELHGRLPLRDVTRAHLRQFKDAIVKLPRSTSRRHSIRHVGKGSSYRRAREPPPHRGDHGAEARDRPFDVARPCGQLGLH